MLRSPLHLLLTLRRLLQRSKVRYRPAHLLFRPIAKTTCGSATFTSRISTTPATTRWISIIGQERITSRRTFINRRYQGIQYRTMISSGNGTGTSYQITHILNGNHFFTPRPSVLGVHGGTLPPPVSLRSYVNKPPWSIQQPRLGPSSTSETNDIDDVDDTYSENYSQYHAISHTSTRDARQQPYRSPDIRGIADLVADNDDGSSHMKPLDRPTPGLVHRNQPPKRQSPPLDVLRHDDLSLLTMEKRGSIEENTTTSLDHTGHIYLSIPMDLSYLLHNDTTTLNSTALSILDPIWLRTFDLWGESIRDHLTKVILLIQRIGLEARHYYTLHAPLTLMEFKMKMVNSELLIYLPPRLCSPLPTTIPNVRRWVDGIMNEPPFFDIKCDLQDDAIGPQYFEGIHAFLNHVDAMIDASPAFTQR